jgi:hypothetical protein
MVLLKERSQDMLKNIKIKALWLKPLTLYKLTRGFDMETDEGT